MDSKMLTSVLPIFQYQPVYPDQLSARTARSDTTSADAKSDVSRFWGKFISLAHIWSPSISTWTQSNSNVYSFNVWILIKT